MNRDLLFEIGTEEIPAHFMPGILKEIKEKTQNLFSDLNIDYENINSYGTPRRIVLYIEKLNEMQNSVEEEFKGPSVKIAFDTDGNLTKAAIGFCKSKNASEKDIFVKDDYIYVIKKSESRRTLEILPNILLKLIESLNFPKNMRWGDLDIRFVRPIRFLVALFGSDIIEIEYAGVKSDRNTFGHRFLSKGQISITSAEDYFKILEDEFVIVDQDKRKEMIISQIEDLARKHNGFASIDEDLLEEVIYLVEYPTALCGSFEEKYLNLPKDVVITPMRDHQRYFPIFDSENKLLPLFITVRNGGDYCLDNVKNGNEKVLRARLEDAKFFFEEDRKKSLEEFLPKLETVVFQEGLGNMLDKTNRNTLLVKYLSEQFKVDGETCDFALKAARLSKADLVTAMVGEFSELEGIMGKEYALLDGIDEKIANAIDEHYKPRNSKDNEPKDMVSILVSLADKMDTIVATFSRGLIPTGSQDPFALRRFAAGITNTIINNNLHLYLRDFFKESIKVLNLDENENLSAELEKFFRLRLNNVLLDQEIPHDIIDSVNYDIDDLTACYKKAIAIYKLSKKEEFKLGLLAFVRVNNIAIKCEKIALSPEDFTLSYEEALYGKYLVVKEEFDKFILDYDYDKGLLSLLQLTDVINEFFDNVMVMDNDETIKNNRLSLLKLIDNMIKSIFDAKKIIS